MVGVIRFLLDGEVREIANADPTMTVLQWLRGPARRTGTKEGCAEGDCGACTVLLGELDGDQVRYRAVNACILFVPALDGRELVTVESLSAGGTLHPIQRAMVDCHGSQCGFCTPGFVMSLASIYAPGEAPTDAVIDDTLAGNLCRCTGYAPIVVAAKVMGDYPAPERTSNTGALRSLQRTADAPLALHFTDPLLGLQRTHLAPRSADQLAGVLMEQPDALLTAGCTDVGLWVTKQRRSLALTVSVTEAADLRFIRETETDITIGAAVRYSDALPVLARARSDIGEVLRRLGSVQVRNSGTVCGNIGNGSPIGDTPPLFIAAGAVLTLRRGDQRRTLPLEAYYQGYGRQDRRPGEFIESVTVTKPRPDELFAAYKISKRFDQDISAVCAAIRLRLAGDQIVEAAVAYGGMAGIPKRAAAAEAALTGQPWSEATVRAGMAALDSDFTPLSDHRASAAYRLTVARNLLLKVWLERRGETHRIVGPGALTDA